MDPTNARRHQLAQVFDHPFDHPFDHSTHRPAAGQAWPRRPQHGPPPLHSQPHPKPPPRPMGRRRGRQRKERPPARAVAGHRRGGRRLRRTGPPFLHRLHPFRPLPPLVIHLLVLLRMMPPLRCSHLSPVRVF